MNKRSTMTYAVATATAATLALAGCNGGDEDPTATPTGSSSSTSPSASATTSASPTASPSASVIIPEAAQANNEAGALAFTRFWFEQVNVAYTKPDPSLIPALSTTECKSCANIAGEPRDYASKQQKMAAAPIQPLSNVRVLPGGTDNQVRVSFTMTQNAVNVIDAKGAVITKEPAAKGTRVALVVWKEGQWFMDGLAAPS